MPNLWEISPFFESSSCKIMCVGDVMLDKYIYGNVNRISPEAPVPVLHLQSEFEMLGGVGNVSQNIISFLAESIVISAVGNDTTGEQIKKMINKDGKSFFVNTPKTSIKTRYVSNSQQLLRVDDELIMPITANHVAEIIQYVKDEISSINAVILSDYGKGLLTPDLCQAIIKIAKSNDVPVIVDPKGIDYKKYTGASFLTPNLKEFTQAYGRALENDSLLENAAQELIDQYQLQGLLITQGANGMTFVTSDNHFNVQATAREVFDVSGAGDTVISTFAVAIGKGIDPKTACILANAAAGVVVGKAGTATITPQELQNSFSINSLTTFEQKIMPLARLEAVVQSWRHQNLKIGFTNGCYDLLHAGHLLSLQEAKRQCDRLIVAVNTDDSIKRLKGAERPIQTEEVRSLVLAALEMVDAVILFSQETPLHLIQTIIPEVLIKGADYNQEEVVGADVVWKNGGRVHLVPLADGQSTTNLVKKIKGIG